MPQRQAEGFRDNDSKTRLSDIQGQRPVSNQDTLLTEQNNNHHVPW